MIAILTMIGLSLVSGFADPNDTDRRIAAFIAESGSSASAAPVDRRLRLASCPQPLELNWFGTERRSVLVRCSAPSKAWQIYVPVSGVQSPATLFASQAGALIVQRGDEVRVTIVGDGFTVSRSAEALEGGAEGQWIKVRGNGDDPLRARVIGPGEVTISIR